MNDDDLAALVVHVVKVEVGHSFHDVVVVVVVEDDDDAAVVVAVAEAGQEAAGDIQN